MDDELNLDLDETNQEDITRKDSRIKSLSEKVKTTSKERDDLVTAKEEEAKLRANAEKERDFFKGFNQVSTKYPGANEYQDKILEKVNAGYDVEDATISILAKEGKYTPTQAQADTGNVAGGSATTNMTGGDSKAPQEMSQDERRAALLDMERKGDFHL